MAKNNFLVLIRKRMDEIHREYNALRSAYETLDKVSGLRGRKVVIPDLAKWVGDGENVIPKEKKGKRGRPRKNPLITAENVKVETKTKKGKRGRKKTVVAPSKELTSTTKTIAKEDKTPKVALKAELPKKRRGRPKLNKSKEKLAKPVKLKSVKSIPKVRKPKLRSSVGKKQKRTRVPNLAGRIREIMKEHNRFITNAEITDKLADTYPSKDKVQLSKYLSVVMSQMKGRKEAAVIVKDHKGNRMRSGLWGLPNWFENGKPKNEFLK